VRASSAVECMNSVLRMQQSRHRRMTQPMLDLKRLYWNCRPFRSGPRADVCPYRALGLELPTYDFWALLHADPAQLTQQLSTPGDVDSDNPRRFFAHRRVIQTLREAVACRCGPGVWRRAKVWRKVVAVEAWKVGALAKRTGLTVRLLHHYDEIGLLRPSWHTGSGHRLYTAGDVARLQGI